ncbi:MAG: RsmE family RNA methyltransferase [Actinomycetota bacterium]|nr:RsmE family RNA methyltransferase [Actinomycetota bacterium]
MSTARPPADDEVVGSQPAGDGGPHVFVDSLSAPVLGDEDAHHLQRVLRVRAGDPITISDGAGRWCAAEFGLSPNPVGPVVFVEAPRPPISIGFVVPKGDRPSWIVQKLTELGVDRIRPLSSIRSVVRWEGERGDKQIARLRSVARAAAMQSRQVRIPVIEPMCAVGAAQAEGGVALAHRDGAPPSLTHAEVFIGPEGGWDPVELAGSEHAVDLGTSVLRAETAAIVAGATLTLFRTRLVLERSA